MEEYFTVGNFLYGYCNGAFGRDDYENKICVIVTPFYTVFEYMNREKGAVVLNLKEMDIPEGKDTFSVWINDGGRTILISDPMTIVE